MSFTFALVPPAMVVAVPWCANVLLLSATASHIAALCHFVFLWAKEMLGVEACHDKLLHVSRGRGTCLARNVQLRLFFYRSSSSCNHGRLDFIL